ncbi:hypothetical protein RRG08_037354 [Elysia crispata]|uniref:Uncharacterized protein n=1 Tax=Elysia crispata TaxID=231223 RepID=A0AAE1DV78_9GAST|nr:hypothetical protein RRG08_037354 [Elysia crispata]
MMKRCVLLVAVLLSLTAAIDASMVFDKIECQKLWCTPSTVYRHSINGQEVCCSDILHVKLVVKTVQERNTNVEKCYCQPDPWA